MVIAANQVSLYRKLTKSMMEQSGLQVEKPLFSYMSEGSFKQIEVPDEFEGVLQVNEYDTSWTPSEHDLWIHQTFRIQNPAVLFGEDGLTMPGNKIGIAVHMHSRTSSFQQKISVGTITNGNAEQLIDFSYQFSKAELRGHIELDFFLYLAESNEHKPYQASKVGMVLSQDDIYNLVVVVDGEGSAFPITEFEDKNGPLWKLDKNWVDASVDTFDIGSVNLSLNVAHPLFEQVKGGKMPISRALMGDIMVQAMTMIVQQVVIIEEHQLTEDVEELMPNSVLAAVKYWVSTFEIDTSSMFSIANSFRDHFDREMLKGEKNE